MFYAPGEVEGPSRAEAGEACRHMQCLWDNSLLLPAKINFTVDGLEEFAWRWAFKKLVESM